LALSEAGPKTFDGRLTVRCCDAAPAKMKKAALRPFSLDTGFQPIEILSNLTQAA
jgi:hypothetical protein